MSRKTRASGIATGVAAALALPAIFVGTPALAADDTTSVEDATAVAAPASDADPAQTAPPVETAPAAPEAPLATETSAAPAAESAIVESVTVPVPAAVDATAPVIASVTPGDGAFVNGTTTFAVDVVESNVSYSYIEFHQNGRWLTDATKEPGSQIHGNAPTLVLDTTRFPDGVYGLKITTTDTSGNSAIKTTSVVVDNSAPRLSSNLVDGQWVSKKQDVVLTVSEANPIAYHAQLYRADGTAIDAVKAYAYAPTTGTLTIPTVNWSSLSEGDYRMVFSARDKAGNATSVSIPLRHDETRPTLELTGTTAVRPGHPGSVGFTASDGYELSVIGANLYDADNARLLRPLGSKDLSGTTATGSFALPTDLAEGTYTARVSVRDTAGNSQTLTHRVVVDSVRPTLELTGPSAVRPAAPGEVAFVATDGTAVSFIAANLYDADNKTMLDALGSKELSGTPATGSFALPTGLADGTYTVRATVVDAAGNTQTATHRVVVDSVRPTLTIDGPAADSTLMVGDLGDVALTATDANGLKRIAANLYDADNRELVAPIGSAYPEGPSWTGDWALPAGLDAGDYTIRASVTDVAGNSKTVTVPIVVVDAEAPVAPAVPEKPDAPVAPAVPDKPATVAPAVPVLPEAPATDGATTGDADPRVAVAGAEATSGETDTASTAPADSPTAAADASANVADATRQQEADPESTQEQPTWLWGLIAAIGAGLAGIFGALRRRR